MGHEVIIYGVIVGAPYKVGEAYTELQNRNERIIRSLKKDQDWPWVDSSIFALPGPHPIGTYRRQIIHFGLSMKDDADDYLEWWNMWLAKFENILRQLFWTSVRLHIERDFGPEKQEYTWTLTEAAMTALLDEFPRPVADWTRSMQIIPGEKLRGT